VHPFLLIYLPGNFRLAARHCKFYLVGSGVIEHFLDFAVSLLCVLCLTVLVGAGDIPGLFEQRALFPASPAYTGQRPEQTGPEPSAGARGSLSSTLF
jgi:hypothetical protein